MAGLVEPTAERRSCSTSTARRRLRLRFGFVAALVLVGLTVVLFLQPAPLLEVSSWSPMATKEEVWQSKTPIYKIEPKPDASRPVHTTGRLVPFEAHIMSKCPDALVCPSFLTCEYFVLKRMYEKLTGAVTGLSARPCAAHDAAGVRQSQLYTFICWAVRTHPCFCFPVNTR